MTNGAIGERAAFLWNLPAKPGEYRLATAIVIVSTLVFLALALFAKQPLGMVPAFIPIYQSALVINDLITAVFLLGQCQLSRTPTLALLAGGYLFSASISAMHALTFPGLFAPDGLLGAGPQTTAWLYVLWHGGFPLFVIAYASLSFAEMPPRRSGVLIIAVAGIALAAVCGCTLLAIWGQHILPPIMIGSHHAPAMVTVVSCVWILNALALYLLWLRRPYSSLDLWLIVVMCAWLFDIALSVVFNGGRFDLGFYAGRIYGLLAASFVLIVLLIENSKLYVQLHDLRESDRLKAVELHRLSTIDALTGIANRRAFDEALSQEWRRMMRHGSALSLLLIDVDFFKRYNDTYGHVAGDQCLRAIGQVLAGKARRAGEMAARYGGEEFAVLLPHIALDDARKLGEVICAAVREQNILHERSDAASCVTVSIGAASIADLPELAALLSREGTLPSATMPGATVLVELADHMLYRAKIAGRNRVIAAGAHDGSTAPAAPSATRRMPSAA
jgi:diguanylate cyclase (GGDEF)-like protein